MSTDPTSTLTAPDAPGTPPRARGAALVGAVAPTLLSAALLGLLCTGAAWSVRGLLPDLPEAWAAGASAGAAAIIIAPWLFCLHIGRGRAADRLADAVAAPDAPASAPPGLAPWLRPAAERVCAAVKRWADRCAELNGRLREAEIRLSISEAERRHSEAILHSLKDAVLVTDAFNEITIANATAGRLLGFDPENASHLPIDSAIRDESLKQMIKEVRKSGVLARQKRVEHTIVTDSLDTPGHQKASFDVTIACLPDAQQEVGGVVTILRDITREKEISQLKSDFVSQASHELRTPLSSINAYIEMLLDSEAHDEATRQEFYQIIKSEAERVSRMIDNMLNISRIEAGIVSVDRAEVDFASLIRGVIEAMQPQARAKNIMLVEKSGPLIYTAECDRDMMHQVVMNLVSNAIKYTPDGGRVTVTVENDDASRAVLVSVTDTGLGIPPDAVPRLFEKFYRIENYKRIAKGTGLGLNLVKHIVETVHHGQVGVSSQVGMGSRFWFTVPYEFQGG